MSFLLLDCLTSRQIAILLATTAFKNKWRVMQNALTTFVLAETVVLMACILRYFN